MSETITKKCEVCKQKMTAEYNNTTGIVAYKNKYYHRDCFMTYAEGRVSKKDRYSPSWQDALNNIDEQLIRLFKPVQ